MIGRNRKIFWAAGGATAFCKPFGRSWPQNIFCTLKNSFCIRQHLFISSYGNLVSEVVVSFYLPERMFFAKFCICCLCNQMVKNNFLAFCSGIPVVMNHFNILLKVYIFEIKVFYPLK